VLLGLDLGTTNVKAMLTDMDGAVHAIGAAPVQINHIADGGAEQDIEDIWSATLHAIGELGNQADLSIAQAVGVSSQGGAMQLLDGTGRPVGPVVSWLDGRGRAYDEQITAELGTEWFAEHLGHGGAATVVGQLLRLREQDPELLAPPNRIGFVGDVIVSRLCGRAAHDATSLSLCSLYNPSLGKEDPYLLDRLGISPEQLPDLLSTDIPAGTLLQEVAQTTSLPSGIPVSCAVHDQYACALGCGAVNPGDVMFGSGTAWVLLAVTDKLTHPVIDEAFVCRHPVQGLYGQILSLGNGGSAISWAIKTLGLGDPDDAKIDEILLAAPPGSDGLRCMPLLAGTGAEVTGQVDGRLAGLRLSHTPAHILRAVVEGLACELARYLRFLTNDGMSARRLLMCGRAAGGSVTPQIISDVTTLPVECITVTDTSALGGAMIARSLLEPQTPLADISQAMTPAFRTVTPGGDRGLYARIFAEYENNLP